jgi:glycosyltransferase involved in cell wall biosynthesis
MRVLVVHNRYSSGIPSGENVSVDSEVRWLNDAGVDVTTFEASNDEALGGGIGAKLRAARDAPWSRPAAQRFTAQLAADQPDLVHVPNLFPLLTASVPSAALAAGLPVVWTARNRRLLCVDGTNFRDGSPCEDCRPGWRLPGIRHGCYRGSVPTSALLTGATALFGRMTRRRQLTALAISENVRDWLITSAGLSAAQVDVKYNGVEAPKVDAVAPGTSRTFVFASKLAEYKGVEMLLHAWQKVGDLDARLQIVGDGPLASVVRAAAERDPRIEWTGAVSPTQVPEYMASARAVVVPSLWAEPFGRTAAEALALGRPVITTGFGGLGEIVDQSTGWLTGDDTSALSEAIATAAASDAEVNGRSQAARDRHRRLFSPEATTQTLLDVYERTLSSRPAS